MIRAVIISLFLALPAAAVADDKVVTPEEAAKMVGKTVTMEMKVASVGFILGRKGQEGSTVLYSKEDAQNRTGFVVQLKGKVGDVPGAKSPTDLRNHFTGKAVRVEGKVSLSGGRPTIVVDDPSKLKIVDKK